MNTHSRWFIAMVIVYLVVTSVLLYYDYTVMEQQRQALFFWKKMWVGCVGK